MKRYSALFFSLAICGAALSTEECFPPDFSRTEYSLKGRMKWSLGGRDVIVVVNEPNVDLKSGDGKLLYHISPSMYLDGIVESEDGKYLLLLINRPDGNRLIYDSLVSLHFDDLGRIQASKLLPGDANGFNNSGRWIQDIGAISNNGRMVLVSVSRPYKYNSERTFYFYDWELWDTQDIKMLRRGLRISDAQSNSEQPGAGQPATHPADKAPVKDQTSPPTSKDAPR